ncbi:MAG: 3-keto-disaccharide hydrolase, partial [Gemmatimonadota bacterium]
IAGCSRTQPPALPTAQTTAMPAITAKQHDLERAQPPVARPVGAVVIAPPADATLLFDGSSLDAWAADKGQPARWKVENGYMEVVPGSGNISTRAGFGDAQLHVEWATPLHAEGEGQDRANSGVFLMGRYEVQVLDSYGNRTYPDGQAGALYGQYPPLVNASLPPGEWQSYDIIFRRPRFEGNRLVSAARFTVIHNGVVVQDNVELVGPTSHGRRAPYATHADRLPLSLQDHGQAVRYRNIWIRELGTSE